MITWVQDGDLLGAEVEALVNAVNTKGVMGRGLAAQFKARYPDHYLQYRDACASGKVQLGKVLVTQSTATPGLAIIHFPTKDNWRSRSRLHDIENGLVDLRQTAATLGLRSMAVPALGCGLGGLPWTDVRPLIEHALQHLSIDVLVYLPQSEPHQPG